MSRNMYKHSACIDGLYEDSMYLFAREMGGTL